MKVKLPKPFTFESGPRAVLLLHGFTGHSADVRMMGRFLEKKGYTCHAPIYRGHGQEPEELVKASADEWWEDVQNAYNHLKELGYKEIAVAGLSLGGVLGLRLAYTEQVKGIIPMCAPMFFDNQEELTKGYKFKAKEFKQLEGKDADAIQQEVAELIENSQGMFQDLGELITQVQNNIDTIYTPTFVVQAQQDEMINKESATYIFENVEADQKDIKWYEESGHVITMDKEKEQLHEDVFQFLESLDWNE
ncbi:alpha/beta hydrolase [Virgibacillus sp. JSM 102003]|uniref:alpha/beta hydrolase n=1 Tax=Virgibacillus sp. JSM 102003 TaxID=1562108 RepID=UPI0035C26414